VERLHTHLRGIISLMPPRSTPHLRDAFASALIPGLGQLLQGRRRAALLSAAPLLAVLSLLLLAAVTNGLVAFAASFATPGRLPLLTLLLILMIPWRALVVLDAARGKEQRAAISLVVVLAMMIGAAPHAGAALITSRAGSTVDDIFSGFEPQPQRRHHSVIASPCSLLAPTPWGRAPHSIPTP